MKRGRGRLFKRQAGGSAVSTCVAGFDRHWQHASGTRRPSSSAAAVARNPSDDVISSEPIQVSSLRQPLSRANRL